MNNKCKVKNMKFSEEFNNGFHRKILSLAERIVYRGICILLAYTWLAGLTSNQQLAITFIR